MLKLWKRLGIWRVEIDNVLAYKKDQYWREDKKVGLNRERFFEWVWGYI